MDAPTISTLREEQTPPPPTPSSAASRGGPTRIRLLMKEEGAPEVKKEQGSDVEDEEEDQMIDELADDDEPMAPVPAAASASAKRKPPAKPKAPRKDTSKEKIVIPPGVYPMSPRLADRPDHCCSSSTDRTSCRSNPSSGSPSPHTHARVPTQNCSRQTQACCQEAGCGEWEEQSEASQVRRPLPDSTRPTAYSCKGRPKRLRTEEMTQTAQAKVNLLRPFLLVH